MKKFFLLIIFTVSLNLSAETAVEISKYPLESTGDFRYGSGIAYKKASPYGKGAFMFYVFPSGDFQITNGKDQRADAEIPHIAVLKVKKDKSAKIISKFPLYFADDQELLVDLEGVAAAPGDYLWLAEEASNSLLKVSVKTGKIEKTLKAGNELPAVILKSKANRGLESVAVTPSGKIYSFVQSPITFDGEALETVSFVRMIEYDESKQALRTFALPFDKTDYLDAENVKIGDLQALDDDRFILIEQGLNKKNKEINRIFEIDISEATDITDLKNNGQELEFAADLEKLGYQYISKKLILDLNKHGWKYRKAEGLALVASDIIAVTNDADELEDNPGEYEQSEVWLITLPEPFFKWTWQDKAIFYILIFILLFSTVLAVVFAFKSSKNREENQ